MGSEMKKYKGPIVLIIIMFLGYVILSIFPFKNILKPSRNETYGIENSLGLSTRIMIEGLKSPESMAMDDTGKIYIAENASSGSVISVFTQNGEFKRLYGGFHSPIKQVSEKNGKLYISHKGRLTCIERGVRTDIINGLPSSGDYSNNGFAFGSDGFIYFCQGAATNSGVVGYDNFERGWLGTYPYFHDISPVDISLSGINFRCRNPFVKTTDKYTKTGPFLSFGMISDGNERIKGRLPGNSCIMRVTADGGYLDMYCSGLRDPIGIVITADNRIFASVQGMEKRGSRPISGGRDYLYEIKKNSWYGFPDYEGGEPVVLDKFRTRGHKSIEFLTTSHITTHPDLPALSFAECGRIGLIEYSSSSGSILKGEIIIPMAKGISEEAAVYSYNTFEKKLEKIIWNRKGSLSLSEPVQTICKGNNVLVLDKKRGCVYELYKDEDRDLLLFKYGGSRFIIFPAVLLIAGYMALFVKKNN